MLALLLLFSTTVSGGGELRGRLPPKQWHKPGRNCGETVETCLGTVSWCTHPQYYQRDGHTSEADCFRARFGTTDWTYMNTDCLQSFDSCDGTDVVCSRVIGTVYRALCFEGYNQASFLDPFSEGCLGAKREDDERCVGTKVFCDSPERIKSYGSTEACLSHRSEKPLSNWHPAKAKFLVENERACWGDPTEKCLGTETFCSRVEGGEKRGQCLALRQRPPFYAEFSADCDLSTGEFAESCVGTEHWCAHKELVDLYGSEENCRDFRIPEATSRKGRWIRPDYECLKHPNGTETCEGTERFCEWRSDSPDKCYSARELGPFLLAGSNNCSDEEKKQNGEEACSGTDTWCHDGFRQRNYRTEDECFRRRGFEHDKMADKVLTHFAPLIRDIIVRQVRNLILNAVYRNLVREDGDEESARNAAISDASIYMEALNEEMVDSVTGKYMKKIREMAGCEGEGEEGGSKRSPA
ncbi:hypothetical protein L249_3691 [Ophiocordyceps polyrhachis-furcata BCC 54312]|uniref:Uncharacterized protein n=1 Tax=Ophiocordyceps polyrhachis-furcata BCC 54312 TaxID=1330021 RepID=A0A367L4K3_9HYPO|nr:hypothetical protein L249_3691 [Ophiocordyceps polyrhachis-furcata BCC 54312]